MKQKKRTMLKTICAMIIFGIFGLIISITQPVIGKNNPNTVSVNPENLESMLRVLTDHDQARNYRNITRLNEVAEYIHKTFSNYSDKVEYQNFDVKGTQYKNVIASFGPEDGPRIIVGAHYDVCGDQAGADDNATGTVGLLELARLLENKENLKYRVDLVAYTLEEPPYFRTQFMGSAIHAKYLKENNIEVKGMYSLEMIGYFSDEKKSQEYPVGAMKMVYPSEANFIAVIGKMGQGQFTRKAKKNMKSGAEIDVISMNAPAVVIGIDFSDHLNYWNEGFDAVMITNTSFYRNSNYHKPTDLPETLDYDKMAEVIKGVYQIVVDS